MKVELLRIFLDHFDRAPGPKIPQFGLKHLSSYLVDGWEIAAHSIIPPGAGLKGDRAEVIYTLIKRSQQRELYMLIGDNEVIIDNNGVGFSYSAAQDRLSFELDKEKGCHSDRIVVRHACSGYVYDSRHTSAGVTWSIELFIRPEDELPS